MSKLEKLSDKFLRVGQRPFKMYIKSKEPEKRNSRHGFDDSDTNDTTVCCCCHSDSPVYAKLWPMIFLFSALTDFPMPLPKGKKPGQHRDWGWIPVMVIGGILVFVYYGYLDRIVLVLLKTLNRQAQSIGYLVPFNLFFILLMISYGRIVSQTPGYAAVSHRMKEQEIDSVIIVRDNEAIDPKKSQPKPDSILGDPTWCETCGIWKPDRAHHCRVCDACVLRMDHHCPWVNGCVGVFNYRYYIQFLCYTTLLGIWTFTTSLAVFVEFHGLLTFDSIALVIVIISGLVTLMIGSFTLSHIWLVLLNRTTIENSRYQSWNKARKSGKAQERLIQVFTESGKNVFNQGYCKNWNEVMGSSKLLWLLPMSSKTDTQKDGIHYGYNVSALEEYKNEDHTRRLKTSK